MSTMTEELAYRLALHPADTDYRSKRAAIDYLLRLAPSSTSPVPSPAAEAIACLEWAIEHQSDMRDDQRTDQLADALAAQLLGDPDRTGYCPVRLRTTSGHVTHLRRWGDALPLCGMTRYDWEAYPELDADCPSCLVRAA